MIVKKYMVFLHLVIAAVLFPVCIFADNADIAVNARDTVLGYFSPNQGVVESVDGNEARLRIESVKDLKKGMRFSVFRDGTPFYHPVTGEVLGKSQFLSGRIEIVNEEISQDGTYSCEIISGEIAKGDIARITSSKIKLAFFQDRRANWSLSEIFYNSIRDSGRFEILETYASSYEPEVLSGLAKGMGAEAVLFFSTPSTDAGKSMNVKLYWAEDARMVKEVEEIISRETFGKISTEGEFIPTEVAGMATWGGYNIAGGQLIAAGDVDNNGVKEFVVSDGKDIRIYSFGDELRELWHIKGNSSDIHLSLDILDVNRNGRAEIFVTTLFDGSETAPEGDRRRHTDKSRIRSYVMEFDSSGEYIRIAENMPYFFRVEGDILLMQEFSLNSIFSGSVYRGVWEDGTYKVSSALNLPDKVNIYGFAYVDWLMNGQLQVLSFDDNDYLVLYDENNNLVWRSSINYGKSNLTFEHKTQSISNPVIKWSVRDKLTVIKTARGQEVIAVNKIPLLSKVPGLGNKGAEVYSLWWDGTMMDEKRILEEISGTITDYLIEDRKLFIVSKGDLFNIVKSAASGNFAGGSRLYYFNLVEK